MPVPTPAMAKRDLEIAELSLSPGQTYQTIAKQFGITKGRVCQILQKPQIKEIVKQGTMQLIALIPLAVDNYIKILQDPTHSDYYKASRDVLQNTGILASHTGGNTYIQNIYNDNRGFNQQEASRFSEIIKMRQDQDVIDAEIIKSETSD